MAGDWTQIDDDLPDKPEVLAIADQTDEPIDCVCGRLVRLWLWADRHADNGLLAHATCATCAKKFGGDEKFWKCVEQVGWLVASQDGLRIPKWQKRFSKSAKRRMLHARQVATKRGKYVRTHAHTLRTSASPKEEKRREEKITKGLHPLETPLCDSTASPATKDKLAKAIEDVKSPYHASFEKFWNSYPKSRRQAKQKAYKAWQTAGKRLCIERGIDKTEAAQVLQERCEAFAGTSKGKGDYCPAPAAWLTQGRWDDDPESWNETAPARRDFVDLSTIDLEAQ